MAIRANPAAFTLFAHTLLIDQGFIAQYNSLKNTPVVVPDNTPPTLISVFPGDGSTVSLNNAIFYLVFDEILGPTPVVTYLLPGGVTPITAYVEYDQNVMIIAPTSLSLTGVYTFTVQDGSVKDQNFNVDPEHITFSVDLENGLPPVAPHMVATSFWTGDSQLSVTPGARLQFLFSATGLTKGAGIIELHTEDGALVESIDVVSMEISVLGGFSLTFSGLPLHPGQSYYLYVPDGVLVGSGGPSQAFTYHFTAAGTLDFTPPTLFASSPADNQVLAPLTGDIKLTFSEPIKLGSGNFGIYRASNNSLVETIAASSASIDADGKTVNLATGILLDQATQYYVLADAGSVLDMSDNAFAGIFDPTILDFITTPLPSLPSSTQSWEVTGNAQLAAGRVLTVTHDGQFNNEFAVYLEPQDGTEFVFLNYGSIQGKVSGFPGIMAGVFIEPGIAQIYYRNAYFQNYGDISVSGDMGPLGVNNFGNPTGDAAIGIYDPDGFNFPHLENMPAGTINVAAWRAWGIYENGGSGNPVNLGTINVHGSDQAFGYYTAQNISPSFINSGVISVHGGNGNATAAVYSEFGSFARVENSGRIEVWADSNSQNAIGIGMGDGPPESIINSGVISAPTAIKVRANNGLSVLSIVNTGQITGDIYMGAGASNVFDGGGGTYSGTIHGGNGVNTIHAGAGNSILIGGPGNDTLDGGSGADTAIFLSASSAYAISRTGPSRFTVSGPDGVDTLIGIEYAKFSDKTILLPENHKPAVDTANISAARNQVFSLSTLIMTSDADGDAITGYQLWDSTRDPLSGHFEINGVAQAAGTIINVSAAQFAQTSFVAGSVGDSLQIRAFDGYDWSAADNAPWSPFTLLVGNNPPSLSTTTQRAAAGQSLALSSLATVTDADGDTMTRYQLWDSTRDPNSGHWVVNGQPQAAGTVIDITAAQLGQTFFVTGTVNDSLQIRAFDGIAWSAPDTASWAPFTIGPLVNHAPVVQTSNRTIARGVTTALSSLITVSDADSDAITQYQLWDGSRDPDSGHFVVNNVVQAAGTVIDISAAQLSQTSFVTGSLGDSLQIRAFDGISWSAADTAPWSPFTVSVPDAAPVVSTSNVTKAHLQSYALSSLFSVTDADGDSMTRYQLWDSTRDPNSGHFVVNGQALSAGTVIDITAAQLAQTGFFTGTVGDSLQIRAFDGIAWSDTDTASWAPFTVGVAANNPPVVSTGSQNAMHGRTLALSSLFSVTDADGDTMTKYQLWDSIRDPLSGHFVVNGVAQAAGTVIDITAAQLNQTSFVTGQVSDSLQIRAFDGIDWSDADNAPWQPFNVSVTPYTSPSMSTQDVSVAAGQSLALSGLISVTDLDGDSMTRYQLWDSTRDPNSGSWVVNGQVQTAGTVIDITAAQLAQTSFLAGTAGIMDSLQVRAFDGIGWTAGDTAAWAPFHVTAA